jgi:hypothetical protein
MRFLGRSLWWSFASGAFQRLKAALQVGKSRCHLVNQGSGVLQFFGDLLSFLGDSVEVFL